MPVEKISRWVFREVPEHLKLPIFLSKLQDGLILSTFQATGPHIVSGKVPVAGGCDSAGYAKVDHVSGVIST